MKKNGKWLRAYMQAGSGVVNMECIDHSYSWSGKMPCTGMWRCVFCGKPEDETTFNGRPEQKGSKWRKKLNQMNGG